MSALGQKRTCSATRDVRRGPIPDIQSNGPRSSPCCGFTDTITASATIIEPAVMEQDERKVSSYCYEHREMTVMDAVKNALGLDK
jgi:hypothetical protein